MAQVYKDKYSKKVELRNLGKPIASDYASFYVYEWNDNMLNIWLKGELKFKNIVFSDIQNEDGEFLQSMEQATQYIDKVFEVDTIITEKEFDGNVNGAEFLAYYIIARDN